jgi:hypothetical protein
MATDTSLVTPAGRLDRRAVMIEAHRQFRLMRRYGWSFGLCLSFAWAKAREQRAVRAVAGTGALTIAQLASLARRHEKPYREIGFVCLL